MKQITLNGQTLQDDSDTIGQLLDKHALNQGRFAVEIDGQLLPKSRLNTTPLTDGMSIEVVQAVGGG
ncbi:sulfur carrier protein ThiS [Moraxella sp. ZJ142]|uniref:sulfur carrier protein ThiS n=1 Tax=Moraxella marmotae TaxID=3344520 RepID=UPI0035D4ADB6